jgi:hypothetical protein
MTAAFVLMHMMLEVVSAWREAPVFEGRACRQQNSFEAARR